MERTKTENDQKKLQALINDYSREKDERKLAKPIDLSSEPVDQQQQSPLQTLFKQQQTLPVYDYLRNTGAINILENLQSRLKEKEGEIVQLQVLYCMHIDFLTNRNKSSIEPQSVGFV
jgi:hypothetical protein